MTSNGSDDSSSPDKGDGFASSRARQLFGHKGGASPWEKAQASQPSEPESRRPEQAKPSAPIASAPYPEEAPYAPRPAENAGDSAGEGRAGGDKKGDRGPSILGEVDDEGELTRLHPNYKLLMRISAVIAAVVVMGISIVIEAALRDNLPLPTGTVMIPAGLFALFLAIRFPIARYNARGYQISRDRLRVVRGVLWHSDTVVPFGRVQHIDVDQGPIERGLDIATMTLHTAGSHNASVSLPGLGHDLAIRMREEIRAHIKRESM